MRTTLDLDEDVLLVTKELAQQQGRSIGKVLSDLVRQALTYRVATQVRNDLPLFPRRADAKVVTLELINQLRDEVSI
jgi:hypothetical protein